MTDKELLELAAKAAAINGEWMQDDGGLPYLHNWENGCVFDPLNSNGDALRLAVKLEMVVDTMERVIVGSAPSVCVEIDFDEQSTNPESAVRRAIVRAAAEVGKNMK